MKAEKPAEGILKTHDWGNSKMYRVDCSCSNADDSIDFEVEADDSGIIITTYTIQKSNCWSETFEKRYDINNVWLQEFDWAWKDLANNFIRKIKLTWNLWVDGYIKYQSTTIMTEQQALNYAENLKDAIQDVKHFKDELKWKTNHQNRVASKLAEENDCV